MANHPTESRIDDTPIPQQEENGRLVTLLVSRLRRTLDNPLLRAEAQQQLIEQGIFSPQEEGVSRGALKENSKREIPMGEKEGQRELQDKGRSNPSPMRTELMSQEQPNQEACENETSFTSHEDIAPRRRRERRSTSPSKRRRPQSFSPPSRHQEREEKSKKKKRRRSPSSPSSSSSSSSNEDSGTSPISSRRRHRQAHTSKRRHHKLKKFKEGGKNITFLTYDGTYGATDKVLAFIQQFDAAFGDEGFTESSKIRHVSMHLQKSARQWWASLRARGQAPRTWKGLRTVIMKQFLT